MEDTVTKENLIAMWRQELDLTYGNQITELTNNLDAANKRVEQLQSIASQAHSQLGKIIDNLTEDYWYSHSYTKEEILSDVCEILDHNPVKEISFIATMQFSGRIEVPIAEAEDFNIEDVLSDAYVDINHGDVVIDDYELYNVTEN